MATERLQGQILEITRKIIKELTPPLLLRMYRYKDRYKNPIYNSYADALKDCQQGYEQTDLVEVIIKKNKKFGSLIKENPVMDLWMLRTLIGVGLARNKNELSVIDFGGAGGLHYTLAKMATNNEISFNWRVVETSALVKEAKQLENHELKFYESIDLAKKSLVGVDLVVTSGALQYCPNPIEFVKQLVEVNANYIFITRMALNENQGEIISTQMSNLSDNGIGELPSEYKNRKLKYPVTFMDKNKFENILSEKYTIQFKIVEERNAYNVLGKNFDMYGYFCIKNK